MGTGAQVGELPLLVEGDHLPLGQVVDQLYLEGLALLLHKLERLGAGQLKPLKLQLLLADFSHLRLDLLQMFGSKGEGGVHIVVPALVNGGADGQLHFGPQALDRLGHDVGAGVPIGLAVGFVLKGILVVFFRHDSSSLYWGRQIKNAPPLIVFRGEALKLHGSTLLAVTDRRL